MIRLALATLAVSICLSPATAEAQPPTQELLELSLTDLLETRAVTGARHDQRLVDSPRAITVITAEDIRTRNYRSTPDALSEALGVSVQQTNDGGGAPIIRGWMGNQVLVLIDGIRLNTAAFRLGPNQYLNTVDIQQVERIEVVRGAGSVLYGSDALGGVVNIITKSAAASGPPVTTRFFSRLSTASRGVVGRGEISARAGALSFFGGATGKQFGELRGGRDTGVQPMTGYDEWDADGKVRLGLRGHQQITVAVQTVTQRNVFRTDVVQAGTDLRMVWDPEARVLGYAHYTAEEIRGLVERVSVTGSYQLQSERYTRITTAAPTTEQQHLDSTMSLGLGAQLTSSAGPRHLLTYGLDLHQDEVTSRREDLSLTTGRHITERSALADGAGYTSWALFLQDEFDVSPRLHVNGGVRYGSYRPDATVSDVSTGTLRIRMRSSALTGTLSALVRLSSGVEAVGTVAQGFRAPNLDDLTSYGPFSGGFEVPNPDLDPERTLNVEAGLRGRSLRFSWSSLYFVSDVHGLIQREAGLFRGQDFVDVNDNGVREAFEPLTFKRQNAGRAQIHGVELDALWRIDARWTLSGAFFRIVGEELVTEQPLRRIPPAQGLAKLGWSNGDRLWLEGYSILSARQTRLAPGDMADPRIPAGGTPAALTLHARSGIRVSEAMQLTAGVENLTNRTYRTHGSGLDLPGTNLVVGIDWTF